MIALYLRAEDRLGAALMPLLPLILRLVFAGVLAGYFWASGLTKLGPGLLGFLTPSDGAYVQIFPRAMEAAGYDSAALGLWHTLVVLAGTWAEFLLPLLIVLGLATRAAALGMIGFILVQSATDLIGHGAGAQALGAWFDRAPDALILDQRALWIAALATLAAMGGGALSLDGALRRRIQLS
ncbi:MAG TPA: DoxX family membrane protein [Paracoccaceae bacterium]|nr:DoxX family membrane protein [Paracoccaceae bacterium]